MVNRMPELLSPAGSPEKLRAALLYGADAVYLAGNMFGMRAAAAKGFINATDCADYLVASKGLPFRDAYKITGELVALCIERGLTLETLPIDEYKKVCNAFDEGVYEAINLEKCVRDRKVKGAPCPENVRAAAKEVRTIVNGL